MSIKVKISSKHQITIPPAIRKELHLGPGDQLLAPACDGVIVLVPERGDAVEALRGLGSEIWEAVDAQEYVDGERDGW